MKPVEVFGQQVVHEVVAQEWQKIRYIYPFIPEHSKPHEKKFPGRCNVRTIIYLVQLNILFLYCVNTQYNNNLYVVSQREHCFFTVC